MFSLYQIFNFLYEFSQQCVYGFVFFRPKSINGFGKIALYVFVCCSFYQFSVYLKRQCLHSHHGDNHIQPLLLPLVCLSDSMACMETRYQKHFVILSVAFEWELDFFVSLSWFSNVVIVELFRFSATITQLKPFSLIFSDFILLFSICFCFKTIFVHAFISQTIYNL